MDFRDLPIEGILAAPLLAAVEANSEMARRQAEFILKYGFYKKNGSYHAVMVDMKYTRTFVEPSDNPADGDQNIVERSIIISVPLLTLFPLNTIAVDNVDVDLELEVTSQYHQSTETTSGDSFGDEGMFHDLHKHEHKVHIFGKVGHRKPGISAKRKRNKKKKESYAEQTLAALNVNILAQAIPLPVGVTVLLDAYSKSIMPTGMESDQKPGKNQF